jgi:hypothetical protein
MIHLAWQLFIMVSVLLGVVAAYSLALRLVKTTLDFFSDLIDVAVGVFFYVVLVPMVWLWQKCKRPMWRTLTKEQTRDLETWLRRGC